MESREAVSYDGSAGPYFMQQTGGNASMLVVHSSQGLMAQASGQGGSGFQINNSSSNCHQLSMTMGSSSVAGQGEVVKKKRGRPRKCGPDKSMLLVLTTPMSEMASQGEGHNALSEKRKRGRPPGTGRKQMLASLGGWMKCSAGSAFSPQILFMESGEDVASKILQISRQRPRALCITSGNGTVSSVSLRQPASSDRIFTYKGHFQIICLSGSYLVSEEGRSDERIGGLNISLSSPEGHILGGVIDGPLIADSSVQVVTFSFIYDGSKSKYQH